MSQRLSWLISLHGIAIPNRLYFTAVVYSSLFLLSFFSTPNLGGYWTDLNQTWTHIHLWLLFEKSCSNSPRRLPPRARGKPLFRHRLWTLTEHISTTEHDINNWKETYHSTGTPLHAPTLMNFGPKTAENDWRVFAHSLNFRIERHCQYYCMDVI